MALTNMELEVHCPYCINAYGFRQMILNTGGEHVCPTCGHVAVRGNHNFACSCARCRSLTVDVEKLVLSLRKVGIHLSK